jgi:endonuclease-3
MPALTKKLKSIRNLLRKTYGAKVPSTLKDPLDSLIETILSQNTSDRNSIPAFLALKKKYRTWDRVRTASAVEIRHVIKPAGLFRIKADRILDILNVINAEQGNTDLNFLKKLSSPIAAEYLSSLKGVGPKTAACVMLFSLGVPYFPVDTHILRVTKRLGLLDRKASAQQAHEYFAEVIPKKMMYELHLNIIEHGRATCHARNPRCAVCNLRPMCVYFKSKIKGLSFGPALERA